MGEFYQRDQRRKVRRYPVICDEIPPSLRHFCPRFFMRQGNFSLLVGLEPSLIQRTISPDSNPTKETLEKLLKPFGLDLGAKEKAA